WTTAAMGDRSNSVVTILTVNILAWRKLSLFRRHLRSDPSYARRAELEFGYLAKRIEGRVRQEICGGFRIAEGHEDHVLWYIAVRAHPHFYGAASGLEMDEVARLQPEATKFTRRHESHGLGLQRVKHPRAARHRACVPMLEHPAGGENHWV